MPKIKNVGTVDLPVMSEQELVVPEFFANKNVSAKTGKVSWKLVNPLTKTRNLSKRKGELSVKIIRKPVEHMILMSHSTTPIPLNLFTKNDRETINQHFKVIDEHKDKSIEDVPHSSAFKNKERGRPEKLQKNIEVNRERRADAKKATTKANNEAKKVADAENITMEQTPTPKRQYVRHLSEEERKERIKKQKVESAKRIREAKQKAKETGSGLKDYVNTVVYGRNDYPPYDREILAKVGNEKVREIELMRTPLSFLLDRTLNAISLGQFEKAKPYDKLYHLAMVCSLDSGKRLLIEKNAVINMSLKPPKPARDTESMRLKVNKDLSVNEMMENTKKRMGDKFFSYDADANNCQQFIVNILRANGLNSPEAEKFVFQDLKTLFARLPAFTKPIIDTATKAGAKVDEVLYGKGIKKGNRADEDSDSDSSSSSSSSSGSKKGGAIIFFGRDITKPPPKKGKGIKKNISPNTIMPKFAKGSQEAKDHMAKIRGMKGKQGKGIKEDTDFVINKTRDFLGVGLKQDTENAFHKAKDFLGLGIKQDAEDAFRKTRDFLGVGIEPHSRHYGTPNPMGMDIHHHHHYHMGGAGWQDDFKNAFDPNRNGAAKAFDPNQNGLAQKTKDLTNTINHQFTQGDANKFFTRSLPSFLIHQGIPEATSYLGGLGAEALMPSGGPVSAFAGKQLGRYAGKLASDKIGQETGYGFKKGSKEAKDHMARIRAMKGKGVRMTDFPPHMSGKDMGGYVV